MNVRPDKIDFETGEVFEETPEEAKARSLATRKFDFEDMVNADPECPPAALKIVRAYLPFITDFEKSYAYRSIIDLQVDTGMWPQAITDTRRKLVELKYFVPEGKTSMGAQRFRMSFDRENRVLDHKTIAREKLREIDAQRKERQRIKRQASQPVTTEIIITENPPVTMETVGPSLPGAGENHRPVTTEIISNYLENYLDDSGSEGEVLFQDSSALSGYDDVSGDNPDLPYPKPESRVELELMLAEFRSAGLPPAVIGYFREQRIAGTLTPAMVEQQLRFAS